MNALAGPPGDPFPPPGVDPDAELWKCAGDCTYFTSHYGVIDDAQDAPGPGGGAADGAGAGTGTGTGTMPFRLWPAQVKVILSLVLDRLVIILKARQLGISWAVCAYVLWLCLFRPGRVVLLFSKGQPEANELLRRVKVLYARLPDWLRARLPDIGKRDNTTEITWSNESRIKSMPATKSAGVSYTASLVVLDEAARMMWGSELYTAVKPTIDAGGQLIVLSTAYGFGNLFHALWAKACLPGSTFRAIFLPWWARPGRTLADYRRIQSEADDPDKHLQEYPSNPIEAFLASGRVRFRPAWIAAQLKHVRDPLPGGALPAGLLGMPGLQAWRAPGRGRNYLIGADVAEGKEDGDFDAAVVLDDRSWEVVAVLHGKWEPDAYAGYLMALSDAYGRAEVVVERNNHGHAVLLAMKLARDPADRPAPFDRAALGPDGDPGWLTTEKTKAPGIDLVAASLRDELVRVPSMALLAELQVYSILKRTRLGAPEGHHDDLVMALYLVLSYLRQRGLAGDPSDFAAGGTPRRAPAGFIGPGAGPD